MKRLSFYLVTLFILVACTPNTPTPLPTSTPKPPRTGDYLGEPLPGAEPKQFGSGFLTGSFHSSPVFSPDGAQVFWAGEYSKAQIYISQRINNKWTKPEIVSFSDNIISYRDPFISPDGSQFFFITTTPLPGSTDSGKENIWVMYRDENGWSLPQPLPDAINSFLLHWTISAASSGNLYFSSGEFGIGDIYVSKFINGEYTDPELLGEGVNTSEELELTPNIAPDESYIIFSRMADENSTPYMYISYSQNGEWSQAKRIENVAYCISPIVTPDRKFVIYMGSPSQFKWRDTSFIEELRP